MASEKSGNGGSFRETRNGNAETVGDGAAISVGSRQPPQLSPESQAKVNEIRSKLASAFSQVTMALMMTPRYRNLSISDLEWLVLEPLLRDRIAIASSTPPENGQEGPMVGLAIWAKVSEAVSARIEEQTRTGSFPVRLKGNDWDSGDIVWLLDVVAANRALATSVLVNFGRIAKGAPVRVHPMIRQVVDKEILEKLSGKPKAAAS